MNSLIKEIEKLKKSEIKKQVKTRIKEFESFKNKPNNSWFSELCFCILTANSKAETAIKIQKEIGDNFHISTKIKQIIKKHKHRFYNNKTHYILETRKYKDIKAIIKKEKQPREWLVRNIKGLGYKEASHFLRNIGYKKFAIIDRHILKILEEHKIIKEIPKTITKNKYLEIEKKFNSIANKVKLSPAELDLLLWYSKTGKVLK